MEEELTVKLGVVISTNDPETVFNAMRLANFAASKGAIEKNIFCFQYQQRQGSILSGSENSKHSYVRTRCQFV